MINSLKLKKILLVEDDVRDIELVQESLLEYKLVNELAVVRDGAEALDYLFKINEYKNLPSGYPILILLDMKLPKLNGLEVLEKVKADDKLKFIPVVIMTSSREIRDLEACYRMGVNAYVVKPVVFSEFVKAIKTLGMFWALINEPPPFDL